MQIIVADDQLSLAIGKKGQNVRLAVNLTTWRLDIHSESKLKEIEDTARRMFLRIPQIPDSARDLIIKTGYTTLEDLADAQVEDLLEFPGLSEETANQIIEVANHILDTDEWPLPPVEPEPTEEEGGKVPMRAAEPDRSEALAAAERLFMDPASQAEPPAPAQEAAEPPVEDETAESDEPEDGTPPADPAGESASDPSETGVPKAGDMEEEPLAPEDDKTEEQD